MSSFVFEILSFQPHISNIIFFQRMIKQLCCCFLELILVQKTQHNQPAHQPGFGQVLLVPVISSFYIPSKTMKLYRQKGSNLGRGLYWSLSHPETFFKALGRRLPWHCFICWSSHVVANLAGDYHV